MSLANGSMLGFRYALEQRVGAGGYSEVWRAHDSVLDRPVAIKLLHSARAEHDETLVRFRNEAQLAGRLTHVNVARVYDFCDSKEGLPPYLVMELIEGPSLAEILGAGALDPARAMDIVAQAAAGLQAAHAAGLVHRDVKPANIMLAPGGIVKITDFGLSHTLGSAPITGTGLLIGTPGYFAPERAAGARATPAGDLYSLGVVGYECLAGAVPFTGSPLEVAMAHRERPLPPLPGFVPAEIAGFIALLTAKDPADRPASAEMASRQAGELRDHLMGWQSGVSGSSGLSPAAASQQELSPGPWPEAPRAAETNHPTLITALPSAESGYNPPRRRRAGIAALAIVAAAAAVAIAFALIGPGSGSGQKPAANSSSEAPAVQETDVHGDALIGEPASVAVRQLRAEGFRVSVLRVPTNRQSPGRVVSVSPAGLQPAGSLVTVVVASSFGDHHHHGHDHNGNGDGGGNGGGDGGNSSGN